MARLTKIRLGRTWRDRLIGGHLRLLTSIFRQKPVPIHYWFLLNELISFASSRKDKLCSPIDKLESAGEVLRVPQLAELLRYDVLGAWAIDRDTVEKLWQDLHRIQPKIIIECGSGISTLIHAKYMALTYPDGRASRVISIEQDCLAKRDVEQRLRRESLDHWAKVIHAPVTDQGQYILDTSYLERLLDYELADWLFVDGPAGPDGCRVWTLPALAKFCQVGTRWYLDDAFRDAELRVLHTWADTDDIAVDGIYPIGKGLATGRLRSHV